jgi:predicted O-linked N-acetylglucosamine transferase (SPINDLY family)
MSKDLEYVIILYKSGKIEEAKKKCNEFLEKNPDNIQVINLLSVIALQQKSYEEAIKLINRAIKINPNLAFLYNNLGAALQELKNYEDALKNFNKAIELNPDYAEAYNNLGIILKKINKFEDSYNYYKQAIKIKPYYSDAYYNLGILFGDIKNHKKSISYFNKAIEINNNYVNAYKNRAIQYFLIKEYDLSNQDYNKLKKLDPDKSEMYDYQIFINNNLMCIWENYELNIQKIKNYIINNKKTTDYITPWRLLTLTDSSKIIKKNLENFIITKKINFIKITSNKKKKIRIGYFSPDFREHAVSHLVVNVFENHDKNNFETFGFHLSKHKNDDMTKRIRVAFNKFIDVSNFLDKDIIALSKKLKIDIAVDLCGITQDNRKEIFINKVAPIQINFIYPGGVGDYMDYLIADKYVVPQQNENFYFEKIIYLPDCYLPYDSKQNLNNFRKNRAKFNLPERAFVYCCLNNVSKFNPMMLNSWIKIIKNTKNSVLFLLKSNDFSEKNIINETSKNNIDVSRIIFTPIIPFSDIFERYYACDLFLDTFPYGAHTTASEALSCGLPLLTIMGEYFHARVSASLLKNLNVPELIKGNIRDYEDYAIYLGNNPEKLKVLKKKIIYYSKNTNTFNTQIYTRNLEKAYQAVYNNYNNNFIPKTIYIN